MPSNAPNPFIYAFPAVVLGAVILYYLYGAVDRLGLETHRAEGVVTGKQVAGGSTTYHTNVVAGRAWTQSTQNPDAHIVMLEVDGESTGGVVSPEWYTVLQEGERVHVEFQRTRFSKRMLVTDIRR